MELHQVKPLQIKKPLNPPERLMKICSGDVTDLNFVDSDCFLLDIQVVTFYCI